jgi:chromosome segregation ATPase
MSNIQNDISKKLEDSKIKFLNSIQNLENQISEKIDGIRKNNKVTENVDDLHTQIAEAEKIRKDIEKAQKEKIENLKNKMEDFMNKILHKVVEIEQITNK